MTFLSYSPLVNYSTLRLTPKRDGASCFNAAPYSGNDSESSGRGLHKRCGFGLFHAYHKVLSTCKILFDTFVSYIYCGIDVTVVQRPAIRTSPFPYRKILYFRMHSAAYRAGLRRREPLVDTDKYFPSVLKFVPEHVENPLLDIARIFRVSTHTISY